MSIEKTKEITIVNQLLEIIHIISHDGYFNDTVAVKRISSSGSAYGLPLERRVRQALEEA